MSIRVICQTETAQYAAASPSAAVSAAAGVVLTAVMAGAEVVGASSFESGPVGDGASARPLGHWWPIGRAAVGPRVGALLWPAGGRVLPLLLASVHGQVHERVAVVHCLCAAAGGPVGFEDAVAARPEPHPAESARL